MPQKGAVYIATGKDRSRLACRILLTATAVCKTRQVRRVTPLQLQTTGQTTDLHNPASRYPEKVTPSRVVDASIARDVGSNAMKSILNAATASRQGYSVTTRSIVYS